MADGIASSARSAHPWTVISRPTFLTGMMGAGKSSVGRVLAERHAVPFVDLDRRIERVFGITVADLFESGELEFRRHERRALELLVSEPGFARRGVVVATGGGAVIDPHNLLTMHGVGVTVFLDAPADCLARRLSSAAHGGGRPMLDGSRGSMREHLSRLLEARAAAYGRCTARVDASGSIEETVASVERGLAELQETA